MAQSVAGPVRSAKEGAAAWQIGVAAGILLSALLLQFIWPTVSILLALLSPLFLSFIAVQIGASLERQGPLPGAIPERADWPSYAVLVPLYRETAILPQLVRALAALDYPPERLDILLLLEADDAETIAACEALGLKHPFRLIIVPGGMPRTKPRALNVGLDRVHAQFLTVFDAEDIPDPRQLKHAVLRFETLDPDVACLQARLSIENARDSWFSCMASIEYAALFDAIKCGLAEDHLPVPLGGTSNHFRMEHLRALGGWDAWNVTEDADLGLRIAAQGWRVADLRSTTHEESPITFTGWLGQRRRWFKGWMQTLIAHSHSPAQFILHGGLFSWVVAMIQLLGVVLGGLVFPILLLHFHWIAWSGWLFGQASWFQISINVLALLTILAGTFGMVVPALIGLARRGGLMRAPFLIALPLYLVLVSLAAWLAVYDLLRRPFHWQKTEHGVSLTASLKNN